MTGLEKEKKSKEKQMVEKMNQLKDNNKVLVNFEGIRMGFEIAVRFVEEGCNESQQLDDWIVEKLMEHMFILKIENKEENNNG